MAQGVKFEKSGVSVSSPKGHKKAGWVKSFPKPWKPIVMRGGK